MTALSPRSIIVSLWAAALLGTAASPAFAIDKCKVKVDKKTGVVLVDAAGVGGPLTWGEAAGSENNPFFNSGTCVAGDKAKKCQIADPATLDAKTAPAGCTLYLDDTVAACSAWIPGCSPGARRDVSLVVSDANGKVVGPASEIGSMTYAYVEESGYTGRIPLNADGTDFQPLYALYYTSSDCSGPTLMAAVTPAPIREVIVRPPATGYVPPISGTMQAYGSILGLYTGFSNQPACDVWYGPGNSTFLPPFGCCVVQGGSYTLDPPVATINLSGFVTPLNVKVR